MANAILPKINLRRTFLIARRDYLGYIKTWGFWISFFLPFIGGAIGFAFTQLDVEFSPPRYETILDETGEHADGILALHEINNKRRIEMMIEGLGAALLSDEVEAEIKEILEREGIDAAKAQIEMKVPSLSSQMKNLDSDIIFVDPPANSVEDMKPYLKGEKTLSINGQDKVLAGLLHIKSGDDSPVISHWSKNINADEAKNLASRYFQRLAESNYLKTGGLTREGLVEARQGRIEVESFDPTKTATETQTQAVTDADKVPYFVAGGLAFFLWLTVFSGAYMLLTSMLEEKLNKLLEMMLASTRFSEIIFGKLLGVAALTLTAMAPYIIIGLLGVVGFILTQDGEMAQALASSFTPKLIFFFLLFLLLGYIFYGACFIAMGALSQSMQDAQTITTPIVIVLTLCVLVVPLGFTNPDSPLLRIASIFPLSAPFAVIARLPSDPPLWELILSAVLLGLLSLGVIWAAGRVFRYGVLSGSGVGAISEWFKRTLLRKKA